MEFLKRIHRLAGEDFEGALTDVVFNEDAVLDQLGCLWETLAPTPLADFPANDPDLQLLFTTLPMAAHQLPAGSQARPIVLDNDDDFRHDDIYGDDDEAPPNLDDLIDDEAEEMPVDHESVDEGDDDVEMDAPVDTNNKEGESSGSEEESSDEESSGEEESSEEEIPARKKQKSS